METQFVIRRWLSATEFLDETADGLMIFADDKVRAVASKLCDTMFKKEAPFGVYLWVTSHIHDKHSCALHYTKSFLQLNNHIKLLHLKHLFKLVFRVDMAVTVDVPSVLDHIEVFNLLLANIPDQQDKRLCFYYKEQLSYEYAFTMNPFAATISDLRSNEDLLNIEETSLQVIRDFRMVDNVLNVVCKSDMPANAITDMYFPASRLDGVLDTNYSSISEDYSKIIESLDPTVEITTQIKKMFMSVSPIGPNIACKLRPIFYNFVLDDICPLIKYRTQQQILYKTSPEFIKNVPREFVEYWKKELMHDDETIVFKINYGAWYTTLILYPSLMYNFKLTFKDAQSPDLRYIVDNIIPGINHVLQKVQGHVSLTTHTDVIIMPLTEDMIMYDNVQETTMVSNVVFNSKLPPIDRIQELLLRAKFLFHKIYNVDHKAMNVINLRYKRCSTYNPVFDINAFVATNLGKVQKQDLVNMLTDVFQVNHKQADALYNEIASNDAKYRFFKYFDGVTIKLVRKSDAELRCIVRGTRIDAQLTDYIMHVIHALVSKKMKLGSSTVTHNDEPDAELTFNPRDLLEDEFFDQEDKVYDDVDVEEEKQEDEDLVHSITPSAEALKDISRYTLKRLQKADPDLFSYPAKHTNYKSYAANCAANEKRQPIMISKSQVGSMPDGAFTNSVSTGSNATKADENVYICPQIWCTVSETAMTLDQFNKNGCPNPKDAALHLYNDGEEKLDKYVGFLDPSKHPKEHCMPCCFLANHAAKESGKLHMRFQKCTGGKVDAPDDRYIKGHVFPLEVDRYGRLPYLLGKFFDSETCTGGKQCFVRKGVQHNSQYFLSCISSVLGFASAHAMIDKLEQTLEPHQYIALNNAHLLNVFVDTSANVNNNWGVFKKWFSAQHEYVRAFGLDKLRDYVARHSHANEEVVMELQREFMVHVSMNNFFNFLRSDAPKDHVELLELFSNWSGVNVLLLEEVGSEENMVYVVCNRYGGYFDKAKRTLIVLKYQQFYEPVCKLDPETLTFAYGDDTRVDKIIDFHMQQCGTLRGAQPGAGMMQMLGANFKLAGYATVDGEVIAAKPNARFDPMLPVRHHITDDITDAHIFVGFQMEDPASDFIQEWNMRQAAFQQYTKDVVLSMLKSKEMRKEVEFLKFPLNPFSKSYKMHTMSNLIMRVKQRAHSAADVIKLADNLLTRDLALLTAESSEALNGTVLLTQQQVYNGDMDVYLQGNIIPHRKYLHGIEDVLNEVVVDDEDVDNIIALTGQFTDIKPIHIKDLLPGHEMVNVELFGFFALVGAVTRTNATVAADELREMCKTRLISFVRERDDEALEIMSRFHSIFDDNKRFTFEYVLARVYSSMYAPGVLEAIMLAGFYECNLVVIGTSKDLRAPPPSILLYQNQKASSTVVLHYSRHDQAFCAVHHSATKRFVFAEDELPHAFVKARGSVIFQQLK